MSGNNNLLILTVGAGTAGKYSDIAQGLRNTIDLLKPRKFWLIPSVSEDSQTVAELVAENQSHFAACLGPIEEVDDLEDCRRTIREAIRQVCHELRGDERLIVNATSGTKAMSAGATIAALDEHLGDINFTSGHKKDGVVQTGTETIVSFDSSTYFQEHDEKTARDFFQQGDFSAAEQLLLPYKHLLTKQVACAATCKFWQRFDYANASSQAASFNQQIKNHLDEALRALKQNLPCEAVLCDILAWAEFALNHQDPENAARLTYKALEQVTKLLMLQDLDMKPNKDGRYSSSYCATLNLSAKLTKQLSQKGGTLSLGVADSLALLKEKQHPFAQVCETQKLSRHLRLRNQNTHAISPIALADAQRFYKDLMAVFAEALPQIKPTILPSYPTVTP